MDRAFLRARFGTEISQFSAIGLAATDLIALSDPSLC
jgi:hypothetical protein